MSVSIIEVIEVGGYDLNTEEDARWLLSQNSAFEELIEKAQDLVDNLEEKKLARSELEYQERFGDL